jgi:hypothetical protein
LLVSDNGPDNPENDQFRSANVTEKIERKQEITRSRGIGDGDIGSLPKASGRFVPPPCFCWQHSRLTPLNALCIMPASRTKSTPGRKKSQKSDAPIQTAANAPRARVAAKVSAPKTKKAAAGNKEQMAAKDAEIARLQAGEYWSL